MAARRTGPPPQERSRSLSMRRDKPTKVVAVDTKTPKRLTKSIPKQKKRSRSASNSRERSTSRSRQEQAVVAVDIGSEDDESDEEEEGNIPAGVPELEVD
ncbi:hypothetical protein PHYPSEUDO_008005 [Phytophthora pseudosyringae]|uniref:Uncharacterized protein n=1 Tax=Phytophthora pseudosyringae TaxID=221518 RepID=A0A8T1VF74_9STRA|nr:hypothetical protein PHYPSEUDO_008005 [Phytophthora pseudosyringae]